MRIVISALLTIACAGLSLYCLLNGRYELAVVNAALFGSNVVLLVVAIVLR